MGFSAVVDVLHLVATVAWIGGMLFMKLVLMPALGAIEPAQRGRLMGAVAGRFTTVAWTSFAVLVVTGVLKTPADLLADLSTTYGTMLAAKHVVVLAMGAVGVVITFFVAPRLRALAPAPGAPPSPRLAGVQSRLDVLSAVNTVLGLGLLVLVSVMRG